LNKIVDTLRLERRYLKIVFFIALFILISANIVLYMNMKDLTDNSMNITGTFVNLEIIEKLRDDVYAAETGIDYYHITSDKEYLLSYRDLSSSIDTAYNKLRTSNGSNLNQQYYLDTLSMLVKERFQLLNRTVSLQEQKKMKQVLYKQLYNEGKNISARIITTVQEMKSEERKALDRKTDVTSIKTKFALLIVGGSTVFSIILLIITFKFLRKAAPNYYFDEKAQRLTQDELESIVRERTAEISQINRKLYKTLDEYKSTQSALLQSEKDYRTLFEQAHDAILIFEPDTELILDVNDRACEMYGINKGQFIGISLKTLSKNVPDGEKRVKMTMDKGYDYNFQSVHYKKNGTEMLMEINASVINYKGKTAILSINRDITDRILSYIPLPGS
jgi:PAS domain S-box-containing protein